MRSPHAGRSTTPSWCEPLETASDDAVRGVLDTVAAVELDDELVALLDEPLRHAGCLRR